MTIPPLDLSAQSQRSSESKSKSNWKADRWNDGDLFHVITGDAGREIVARLYFVDTPEAETAYRDRLDEQAAYFGMTRKQAVEIAHESAAFTAKRIAIPFSIWTRWRAALGRSALACVYCIVLVNGTEDLNELLVENGLAHLRRENNVAR